MLKHKVKEQALLVFHQSGISFPLVKETELFVVHVTQFDRKYPLFFTKKCACSFKKVTCTCHPHIRTTCLSYSGILRIPKEINPSAHGANTIHSFIPYRVDCEKNEVTHTDGSQQLFDGIFNLGPQFSALSIQNNEWLLLGSEAINFHLETRAKTLVKFSSFGVHNIDQFYFVENFLFIVNFDGIFLFRVKPAQSFELFEVSMRKLFEGPVVKFARLLHSRIAAVAFMSDSRIHCFCLKDADWELIGERSLDTDERILDFDVFEDYLCILHASLTIEFFFFKTKDTVLLKREVVLTNFVRTTRKSQNANYQGVHTKLRECYAPIMVGEDSNIYYFKSPNMWDEKNPVAYLLENCPALQVWEYPTLSPTQKSARSFNQPGIY